MLRYRKIVVGEMETNCFLLWEEKTRQAIVIDPGDDGVEIANEINLLQLNLKYICLTHGHFDHCLGVVDMKLIFDIPIALSSADDFLVKRLNKTASFFLTDKHIPPHVFSIDIDLEKIDSLCIGDSRIEVINTPGHTPGSKCFYASQSGILFSGDSLGILEYSENEHQYTDVDKMKKSTIKLLSFPMETIVLPGHGENTTISDLIV